MDAFDTTSFAFGDFAPVIWEPKIASSAGDKKDNGAKDSAVNEVKAKRPGVLPEQLSNHVEIHSVGSAGDIHVGSLVHFSSSSSPDDSSVSSGEITLDAELAIDELRFDDHHRKVPAVNEAWTRNVPKGSLTRRIAKSFRQMRSKRQSAASKRLPCCPTFEKPDLERRMSSRRCLLHYSDDGTFDRRHVLSGSTL
jgi:hypothetical protein